MKITNLSQAATVLHDYIPNIQSVNWSFALDDMKALMSELGNPQEKIKIIHVAGTSGKTSTAYYIADMLQRAGKTVGLTVSPHVDSVNERVQVNGQPLPETEFCQMLGEFIDLPAVKKYHPSYFGLLAAFAFWVFARQGLDYAVIEVGLGGRLDATNVVTRPDKIAVITDIGLDHTELLGNDVATIAGEKAGIIYPGNQVFVARQDASIIVAIESKATSQQAHLQILTKAQSPQSLPLFQQRNWNLARVVVDFLAQRDSFDFSEQQAQASVNLLIPGRMETINQAGKTVIMDGAHNAQKIIALSQSLKQRYPNQKLAVLVSFAQGKDTSVPESLEALQAVASQIIITTFRVEQDVPKTAIDPMLIQKAAQAAGFTDIKVIKDPRTAYQELLGCSNRLLLITGSFYLLNHIRPLIKAVV